jgi:hypothetical protein
MSVNPCERHQRKVCYDCAVVSDSAKRAYDIVNAYVAYIPHEQRIRSFIAIRLADGGSDGQLYDSKREAVRHQLDESHCAYFTYRDSPNGFANPKEAQVFLDWHRMAYDNGFRLADPDKKSGGDDLIMPLTQEHTRLALDSYMKKTYS